MLHSLLTFPAGAAALLAMASSSATQVPAVPAAQTAGSAAAVAAPEGDQVRVKSVILIVCDGMGPGMVSTVAEATRESRGPLVMESMPVTGLLRTASRTGAVTDSAAAATAYATGRKAENSTVNWFPGEPETETLVQLAERSGRATGLLTTTNLTDATPASFIASSPSRHQHAEIYKQMIASDVDLLVGGLRVAAIQSGAEKRDVIPMTPEMQRAALVAGRLVLTNASGLPAKTDENTRMLVSYSERSPLTDAFGPKLSETLGAALRMLGSDPDGFFLMAEVEETDNAGHGNDTDRVIAGLIEGDDALRVALDYQREHPDTLVLLTADHDTGSMAYDNEGNYKRGDGKVMWVSGNHTATRVPIFASGPGAHRFTGMRENTEVYDIIRELMGTPAAAQK